MSIYSMIDLSVIIPIYNAEKNLSRCLDSLKRHKLENVEFIMVDDGSTDKTKDICKKYIIDKRFKYIYKVNGGQVSAYLKGIEISKGRYIGFVDADDYVREDMYKKMLFIADKDKTDIVICGRYDIDSEGEIISQEKMPLESKLYTKKDLKIIYDLTLPPFNGYHLHNSRWNKIYRREIILKNIKYCIDKVRTFEDRFIVPACIFSSTKISIINEPLYYYSHDIETSHLKCRPELYEIIKKLNKRQKDILIENGLFEQYKNKYELAQLNYLSLFIDRNIINHGSYKEKKKYANEILKDEHYKNWIKAHKRELKGKKGALIKLCYKFKSPTLLVLISYLAKK